MSSVPSASAADPRRHFGGLLRHSAIYGAAPLLRNAISFGMQRFYTGWLGTSGFGVKEAVDFWLIAFQQLLGFNVLGAMMRFYFEQRSEEQRAKVVTSCTLLIGLVAWIVCGLALCFSRALTPLMVGEARGAEDIGGETLVRIVQLTLLLIPFQLSTFSGYYYLMTLKRSALYTSIQTVKLLLEVALNFWLIGARGLGVEGFLLSMLIGEALTTCCLCGWMLTTLKPRLDFAVLRPILLYAGPLIPVGVCQLMLHQVDRRLLLHFTDQATTGVYGLGYKIAYMVTILVLSPFVQIWQPAVFAIEDGAERARLVARGSTYGVLAIGVATLGVIAFGRQGAMLLSADPAFWAAYRIIPLVAGGYVFWALYHVSQMPLFLAKRTGRLLVINAAAVLVNLSLNLWLIPAYGFLGAGITAFVTFAVLATLGMAASRSAAHVPFEFGRLGGVVACILTSGALTLWIDALEEADRLGLAGALALKSVVLVVLVAALWLGVLSAGERAGFTDWARARIAARRG